MRTRRVVFSASLVAVAGCNLLTGASGLSVDEPEPLSVPPVDPDTGTPIAQLPESGAPDGGTDATMEGGSIIDAGPDGDAGPVANAKRVFVTSSKTEGSMNGVVGADQICSTLAGAQSLGGTWVAWLSVQGAVDAIDRVTHTGPWVLVDRTTLVATDKSQLMSLGGIAHAIDRDEKGIAVQNDDVWTGTRGGRYFNFDCEGWKNVGFNGGQAGKSGASNGNWTSAAAQACTQARRLYCFEN